MLHEASNARGNICPTYSFIEKALNAYCWVHLLFGFTIFSYIRFAVYFTCKYILFTIHQTGIEDYFLKNIYRVQFNISPVFETYSKYEHAYSDF